ncbi:MAG: hypothetical protein M9904_04690 [Chitinophagaceae bacterium]|nr:hypothetical protein [Chitinophagaceae bacterium]
MNLKQWSAAFLLLSFMAQVLSSPFIVLDYYVNTGAYAVNCENKAKPELHCNGKCQMAKELKQQKEKEQEFPGNEGNLKTMVSLFAKSGFASAPVIILSQARPSFPVVDNVYTNDISFPVFHPPARQSSVI